MIYKTYINSYSEKCRVSKQDNKFVHETLGCNQNWYCTAIAIQDIDILKTTINELEKELESEWVIIPGADIDSCPKRYNKNTFRVQYLFSNSWYDDKNYSLLFQAGRDSVKLPINEEKNILVKKLIDTIPLTFLTPYNYFSGDKKASYLIPHNDWFAISDMAKELQKWQW